jgi:GTPase SAR1 family protein
MVHQPKSSDDCLEQLRVLREQLKQIDLYGQTEADTRARMIDRILHQVLDWPIDNVTREEHANPGFMDYVLHTIKRVAVVEAKKSGDTFLLPVDFPARREFSLNGVLKTAPNLKEHLDQVFSYCVHNGIEFAVVTNGHQFIAFKAIRTDGIHVWHGKALVFNGLEDIERRFVEFWNLLSKQAVENNSLARTFQGSDAETFAFNRVTDQLHGYGEKVSRNDLSPYLEPLINEYMGEITDQKSRLKELYVRSTALEKVLHAVERKLSLHLSKTVSTAAAVVESADTHHIKKELKKKIDSHLSIPPRGEVVLLLGRVGSGKTTFINHFLRIDLEKLFEHHVLVLFDFRNLQSGNSVHNFFYQTLQQALSKDPHFVGLSSKQLRQIYAPEIRELSVGPLAVIEKQNKKLYEEKISEMLLQKFSNIETHYSRVIRFLADKLRIRCVFVFDNADQLDFELQQQIFAFAYSVTNACHAFSLVPMWEETFLRSKGEKGTLATYRPVAYTVPPTSVVEIINRRLEYIIADIKKGGMSRNLLGNPAKAIVVEQFLRVVSNSIFHQGRRVRFFLESIAMGNLRRAMELFSLFLTSGHTDAMKIVNTFNASDSYLVPLHEFIKSIGLGDNKYYQSDLSQVLSLYAISDESRPSHFTKVRLLEYLYYHRNRSSQVGLGFIRKEIVRQEFGRIGTSEVDLAESLKILSQSVLIENDFYDSRKEGNSYRITPAGRYYVRYLAVRFAYLDLVLQDTPIADKQVVEAIASLIKSRDLRDRFARVDSFLGYLISAEEREYTSIVNTSSSIPLRRRVLFSMVSEYQNEKTYILKRWMEKRDSGGLSTPYHAQ